MQQAKAKAIAVLQIGYYPALLQMRQSMLEHEGYAVTSALGNDQGMAVATTAHFDVIVVGFCSDTQNRIQMVRWLKQNVPSSPIVALLANNLESLPEADFETLSWNPSVWLTAVRTCAKPS